MITMIDEIFDRGYQAARAELNTSLRQAAGGLSKTLADSLKVLHRIEWSAPWAPSDKRIRRA
jgi:hypothetical protein